MPAAGYIAFFCPKWKISNTLLRQQLPAGLRLVSEHFRPAIALASELCDHASSGGQAAEAVAGARLAEIWIVFAIIAGVIGLFIWDRLPVIAVCVGCAMALWATGVLTLNQALAGFGDPATIFVTSLFVVSGALEKTGLTAWTGQLLARGSGASRFRLIVLMMLFCGVLSALISVNGAVAALLPVVVVLAVRLKRPPSQLLMPLVFGAHSGSMLALTGTPVNVLVYEASLEAGAEGFGYFEFAYVGVFLVIGTILIALLLGSRLLPVRENRLLPPDLSRHARTLVEQFRLDDGVHQLRVRPESPLVGKPRAGFDLGGRAGLTLLTLQEAAGTGAARLGPIEVGDLMAVRGDAEAVAELAADLVLSPADAEGVKFEAGLFTTASGLAEVIIPPRSPLIGERLFPGMVTPSGTSWCWRSTASTTTCRRARRWRRATPCCCRAPGRRSRPTSRRLRRWSSTAPSSSAARWRPWAARR